MFDGTMSLSPTKHDPLMAYGAHDTLETMTNACMAIALRVVCAKSLRPAQKGLTSNPMCEVSLVYDDGMTTVYSSKSLESLRLSVNHRHRTPVSQSLSSMSDKDPLTHRSTHHRVFKSTIVRSSLNPIWEFDVDFGDLDMERVLGVQFLVRHVEKFGVVKKDLGHLVLSIPELLELKMTPAPHERVYNLQPTDAMLFREQEDGVNGPRAYGTLTIRYQSYGAGAALPPLSPLVPPPPLPLPAPDTRSSDSVLPPPALRLGIAHEDDFGKSARSLSLQLDRPKPKRKHDTRHEFEKLKSFHESRPKPGDVWYAIHAQWVADWLLFITKYKGDPAHDPGAISNSALIGDDLVNAVFQLKRGLRLKTDYRVINKASWDFYVAQYGGGPAIEVPLPAECSDTLQWLNQIELHEVGRVSSTYVSSDSDR